MEKNALKRSFFFVNLHNKEKRTTIMLKLEPLKHLCSCVLLIVLCSCSHGDTMSNDVIAQTDRYVVTADSVVQGRYVSRALSAMQIESNYEPAERDIKIPERVAFKLAFNAHDNELPSGSYHYVPVENDTVRIVAGVAEASRGVSKTLHTEKDGKKVILQVDLRAQEDSLQAQGYFVTATRDTIYADSFNGVWVVIDDPAYSQDFKTLGEHEELKLKPSGEKGIYELPIVLGSRPAAVKSKKRWQIKDTPKGYPAVSTGATLVDALYNMAIGTIHTNKVNGNYVKRNSSVNDITYPITLSLACLDPDAAMKSLKMVVTDGRISHDSKGELWPIVSDDISWASAAWEVYCVTGNKEWLDYAYDVVSQSIEQDYETNFDEYERLMHGGTWYSLTGNLYYPSWMQLTHIYESMSLTNNAQYAHAFEILNDMCDELGIESEYGSLVLEMRDAINEKFWNERKGYYSQYTYLPAYPIQSPCIDNLGQALCVLWNIANDDRAENLIMKTPLAPYGVTVTSPHYSSGGMLNQSELSFPMIQAFWNIAAAKTGNEHSLRRGLGALYRLPALYCSYKSWCNAYTGETQDEGDGSLGAAAANASMVFRVYAGITFLPNGIELNPFIPVFLKGRKEIKGFKYRRAVLDITIEGTGNDIESIKVDGVSSHDNFIPSTLTGHHTVHITMCNNNRALQEITVSDSSFSLPPTPELSWRNGVARIENYDARLNYRRVINGELSYSVRDTTYMTRIDSDPFSVRAVLAIGKYSMGYVSNPFLYAPMSRIFHFAPWAGSGTGAASVESGRGINTRIVVQAIVDEPGTYMMDVRYANGNGNVSSTGTCAARKVIVNTHRQGTLVMPALGLDEWHRKGMTNMVRVDLLQGLNEIELSCEPGVGSDIPILLDYMRLIKK